VIHDLSRRAFLRHSIHGVTTSSLLGTFRNGMEVTQNSHGQGTSGRFVGRSISSPYECLDPDNVRVLAFAAIDAAKSAGATYADVRLIRTVSQNCLVESRPDSFTVDGYTMADGSATEDEFLSVGVRALVGNAWGFSASPYWTPEEMRMLAHDAVAQAKVNAVGALIPVEFGLPQVVNGHWTMPGIDPFTIPVEEKLDYFNSWCQAVKDLPPIRTKQGQIVSGRFFRRVSRAVGTFVREERFFASSEGSYTAQTLYRTYGEYSILVTDRITGDSMQMPAYGLGTQGKGWEMFEDAKIGEQLPRLLEEGAERLATQHVDTQNGRYEVVLDARTTARLIAATFGSATQLDRALGYEANAGGASYLGPDPLSLLGTFSAAAPNVTITANRSHLAGLATVKWDDEGIEPEDFSLIQQGILVDYQTTREQAAWLSSYYKTRGLPIRSHGCATSDSALFIPIQHTPNLVLEPGAKDTSIDTLIGGVKRGIAVIDAHVSVDSQSASGTISGGRFREIVNGKLGRELRGRPSCLFRTTELWKSLIDLGGKTSSESVEAQSVKGEPSQSTFFTVTAVPALFRDVTLVHV
jgi:TldD protein